ARQRLKGTNRRDAAKLRRVGPAGYVNRYPISCEHFRHSIIGEPSLICDSGFRQFAARGVGIANSIHGSLQSQALYGLDQKLAQLLRALVVAPVSDPDQIAGWRW